MMGVVGRIMATKDAHVLIPGTCEYVTRRDVADVIRLRTLRWGDGLGLPGWAHWNHKRPSKQRLFPSWDRGKVSMEEWLEGGGVAGSEDGRNMGSL